MLHFAAAATLCAAAALLAVVSSAHTPGKRYLRLFDAICLGYLATVYVVATLPVAMSIYALRSGIMTSIGGLLLALLLMVEIIADWERNRDC